ncbi:MAG TPA: hypothetical protein VNA19_02205 [Pyrinomonadaceae bacterium]|jgi:hypothetical protein|nr:hypothetical protein [Pyrinomonadaceae bacterium]
MGVKVEEIKQRIVSLADEELLGVVRTHHDEYGQAERDIATQELARRGISFAPPTESPSWFPTAQPALTVSGERNKSGWKVYLTVCLVGILCIILFLGVAYLAVLYDDNVQSKYLRRVIEGFGIAFLLLLMELGRRWEAKKAGNDLQVRAKQDSEQPHA